MCWKELHIAAKNAAATRQKASISKNRKKFANFVKTMALRILFFLTPLFVLAHGDEEVYEISNSYGLSSDLQIIIIAAALIFVSAFFALAVKPQKEYTKRVLFAVIAFSAIAATIYVAGFTIYKNVISVTRGPVHWHADVKIFNCGEEVIFKEPEGLANRTGTSVFHHHGDNRIHVEGRVEKLFDVSLHRFFEVVGGKLEDEVLVVPTNEGMVAMLGGDVCPNGNPGILQVFVYKTEGSVVHQEKLRDASNYVISPYTAIPPGDCIIFEFTDERLQETDKICGFYKIEIEKGNLIFEQL